MSHLIYYSLVPSPQHNAQLVQSVRSVRRYNPTIAIHLFHYGPIPSELTVEAGRHNVVLHDEGNYVENFAHPARRPAFQRFPTLHKFRYGRRIPDDVTQVLYLDTDTFFLTDPVHLFNRYNHAHVYAREEVMTRASHFGYHPEWVDEEAIQLLCLEHNLTFHPPCNTGVVMLNHRIWQNLTDLDPIFLDFAWRLMLGAAYKDPQLTAVLPLDDRAHALPYPVRSPWLVDEVAFWLTLGCMHGLHFDLLKKEDVIQGGEINTLLTETTQLVHYWSNQEENFFHIQPRLENDKSQTH